jgi:hypothetical protein
VDRQGADELVRTREEHLAWAKERALEYADRADLQSAVASMASDLGKHAETKSAAKLVVLGIMYVASGDHDGVRRWIEGFR